jgi:drug/metabolite transporter (DMT)-like permease
MSLAGGLVLALLSAFALNWGFFRQHDAASGLPPLSLRSPLRSLRSLFTNLSWLTGFLVGIAGWAFYVAALALAPLSLVQATSAGGIGILAVLVRRHGVRVARSHWLAVGAAVGGLALLGLSLTGGARMAAQASPAAVAAALAACGAVAAVAALRGPWMSRAAALGVAAGVLYGAGDIATKAATFGGGWLVLVPVVLAAHGLAFVALQFGFQRGGALPTAGTATLLTNALPILAGITLFHERVPGGALGGLRVVAFALVVAGAALLSAPLEEGDGLGGEALAAPREAEPVGGRRPHVHLAAAERLGES